MHMASLKRKIGQSKNPKGLGPFGVTLSSFISDPNPEQRIPKALALLCTLVDALQTHCSNLSSRNWGHARQLHFKS